MMPSDHLDADWWDRVASFGLVFVPKRRVYSARDLSVNSARLYFTKRQFEAARRGSCGRVVSAMGRTRAQRSGPSNVLMWGLLLANRQSAIELHLGSERHELMRRQGFTVSHVVHDYGDVFQAITELAVELRAAISMDDCRTLNDAWTMMRFRLRASPLAMLLLIILIAAV